MEDYDAAQYLIHFIFGLRPEIMRGLSPAARHHIGSKRDGRKTGADASMYWNAPKAYFDAKNDQNRAAERHPGEAVKQLA